MYLGYPPVDRRSGVGHGFVRTGVESAVIAARRLTSGRLPFLRQIAAVVAATVLEAGALLVNGVQIGEIGNRRKDVAVAVWTVNYDVVVDGRSPQFLPGVALPTCFDQQSSLPQGTQVSLRSSLFLIRFLGQ